MTNLENQIEAILLFKNEPVSIRDLANSLESSVEDVTNAISRLQDFYQSRGVVVVTDGEQVSFGTHPEASTLVEAMQKDELSRELGKAGLETLAIVLYKGPVSRSEIDHIRGVNSTYILRSLLVRGLIEKVDSEEGRGYSYKPTLKLLEHLGATRLEDLPEYGDAYAKLDTFLTQEENRDD